MRHDRRAIAFPHPFWPEGTQQVANHGEVARHICHEPFR